MREKSTADFALNILLFENYICPLPKKLASQNSLQEKDDKVGNKTVNIEERQRKRKRAREKDRNRFAKKKWLLRMGEKQKCYLIASDWSESMPFFLQNSF